MKATTVYQLNLAIFLAQNWNERLPAEPKSLFLFRTATTVYLLNLVITDICLFKDLGESYLLNQANGLVQDRDERLPAKPSNSPCSGLRRTSTR